jgi:hypothetical protein
MTSQVRYWKKASDKRPASDDRPTRSSDRGRADRIPKPPGDVQRQSRRIHISYSSAPASTLPLPSDPPAMSTVPPDNRGPSA